MTRRCMQLRLRLLLGIVSAVAILVVTASTPAAAQTAQDLNRALQADRADQNLGQLDPTKEPLDWITGLEVRPEGITEVNEPPPPKKKKTQSR